MTSSVFFHAQFEARVHQILERVKAREKLEDSTVELKREWPDEHLRAARQLGGLANAARGLDIVWIVGVDEGSGQITGAPGDEMAEWWPKVKACFDAVAPRLKQNRSIVVENATVHALLFETTDAPYLSKRGRDSVDFEIPWREGNTTRSVKRRDLLDLLLPRASLPEVELVSATASIYSREVPGRNVYDRGGRRIVYTRRISVQFYFVPNTDATVVVPFHRCKSSLKADGSAIQIPPFRLEAVDASNSADGKSSSVHSLRFSASDVSITGPGMAIWKLEQSYSEPPHAECMELGLEIACVGAKQAIKLSIHLVRDESSHPSESRFNMANLSSDIVGSF